MTAWIKLSPEPTEPSRFSIDGQHSEATNPNLAELLALVDETEELVQPGLNLWVARGAKYLCSTSCREAPILGSRLPRPRPSTLDGYDL